MQEISLHILDIAQNSIAAGASLIEIKVRIQRAEGVLEIAVIDNGVGMAPEDLKRAADPLYSTRAIRQVGMGLPLLKMASERTGGSFSLDGALGVGCVVRACFVLGHVDTMPLGDMPATLCALIAMNEGLDFLYKYTVDGEEFLFDTREIKEVLEGISLSRPEVLQFIKEQLKNAHITGVGMPQEWEETK